MPKYFEGDCTVHSCETYIVPCFCCSRDNPSQGCSITQRVVSVLFFEN